MATCIISSCYLFYYSHFLIDVYTHINFKKQAAKEKLSQMKAELSVASQEIKAAKEEQDAQRRKSVRCVHSIDSAAVSLNCLKL